MCQDLGKAQTYLFHVDENVPGNLRGAIRAVVVSILGALQVPGGGPPEERARRG